MISAKVIAASFSSQGQIVSMELVYPRFIHSEFMTHRVFSRNASSSRAIPVKRMLEMIEEEPAMPVEWGSNKPGMQAGEALQAGDAESAQAIWREAMIHAVSLAREMSRLGVHKQVVNRLTEPFAHIKVIVTATEWANFFKLRISPFAQPEIQVLAKAMKAAMDSANFVEMFEGQWHLPYVTDEERAKYRLAGPHFLASLSAARCARVSYLNHDQSEPDISKDIALAASLATQMHASPFEHQATPSSPTFKPVGVYGQNSANRNFKGWDQFRGILGL